MKVPNKILHIAIRAGLSPHPDITPLTDEEKAELVKWAREGMVKRAALNSTPKENSP